MSDNKKRRADEFWDLASLLPKKRKASLPRQDLDVSTVLIEAPPLSNDKAVPTSPEIAGDFSSIPQRFREVERPGAQKEHQNPGLQEKKATTSAAKTIQRGSFGEKHALMRSSSRANMRAGAEVKTITETKKEQSQIGRGIKNSGYYKRNYRLISREKMILKLMIVTLSAVLRAGGRYGKQLDKWNPRAHQHI